MGMSKDEVVRVLERIAILLELDDANPFEVMAFRNGAGHLDDWDGDLEQAVAEGTLTNVFGIGKGIAAVVSELISSGRSERYETLLGNHPESLLDLFRVPGLGLSKIKTLYEKLGIDSLESLEQAAQAGRIRTLKGFGAKSEERIIRSIEYARR